MSVCYYFLNMLRVYESGSNSFLDVTGCLPTYQLLKKKRRQCLQVVAKTMGYWVGWPS